MRGVIVCILLATGLGGCVSAKNADRARTRADLGVAYFREGSTESAIATLREAVDLDRRNWRAWNALGIAYVQKGEPRLAERAFDRALRAAPGEGEVLVTRGAFLVRNGRPHEGVRDFRAALADLDYRNPAVVLSNLSYALVLDGDPRQGAEVAREAVRRAPTLCEARYHLGFALERAGETDAALAAYRDHVARCPDVALGAKLQLGCMLSRTGDRGEGEMLLQEVLQGTSAPEALRAARACLEAP